MNLYIIFSKSWGRGNLKKTLVMIQTKMKTVTLILQMNPFMTQEGEDSSKLNQEVHLSKDLN
jgi:hypothetical protein